MARARGVGYRLPVGALGEWLAGGRVARSLERICVDSVRRDRGKICRPCRDGAGRAIAVRRRVSRCAP